MVEMHEPKAKITWSLEFSKIGKDLISSNIVILKFCVQNADPFHNFKNKNAQKLDLNLKGKSLKAVVWQKADVFQNSAKSRTM